MSVLVPQAVMGDLGTLCLGCPITAFGTNTLKLQVKILYMNTRKDKQNILYVKSTIVEKLKPAIWLQNIIYDFYQVSSFYEIYDDFFIQCIEKYLVYKNFSQSS